MAERDNVDGVSCTGSAVGASSSAAAAVVGDGDSEEAATFVDIPIVADALTLDESLAAETRKLDDVADTELRRQRHRWRQEVDTMRDEIVPLGGRRAGRRCRSQSPTTQDGAAAASRRQQKLPRNYFRRFFDTSGFDQETVRVSVERGTLVLGVDKVPELEQSVVNDNQNTSATKDVRTRTRYYRFPIPPSIDLTTMRAVLSTDGVLLIEANTGNGILSSPDHSLGSSGTDSGAGPPVIAKREKIGKPTFRDDDDGKRRMHLLVDVGDSFRPKDIYVQAIKSDRFQVCQASSY